MAAEEGADQPELQQAPRVHCLGDEAWITQQRVPQEVPEIQPERLQVPDFLEESPAKPTVIVPDAQQYTKVQWNEFPTEEEKERQAVPRVRAQDWVPENDEEQVELGRAAQTKAQSDDAWIQQNVAKPEDEQQEGDVGNAPWRNVSGQTVRERAWPPPEAEAEITEISNSKLAVQWPPAEFEEKEQQVVEVLHTSFARNKHTHQWPPVAPGAESQAADQEEPVPHYA
ncbi:Y43F8B.1b-like protein [Aphelenchoides fujianensis]|nr:Y43F8B.1b-like protein [Aphelenchoides fujianensis]